MNTKDAKTKIFGTYETPMEIFEKFILPEIRQFIWKYLWVDMFCGSGTLVLPILRLISKDERIKFFEDHIFCFDILPEMVKLAIKRAKLYGIPEKIARKNIKVRDSLKNYPVEIFDSNHSVFHVTNPPYLYLGYIRKHKETIFWLEYFKDQNKGYQDLYQLALVNDLRHKVRNMIYIIPTNFLYGFSVSNKIRKEFLRYYQIEKVIVFEKKIFEHTGQHVGIFFFHLKDEPRDESQRFRLHRVRKNEKIESKIIEIHPGNQYRAGTEFDIFIEKYRSKKPLKVRYYLFLYEILRNKGEYEIIAIDANNYNFRKGYLKARYKVNKSMYDKIKQNILFVKTIDGLREKDRAGIYIIRDFFGADCIVVSKKPYRTHPIQIFIEPELGEHEQKILKKYFNKILNYFRKETDSEFLTTYKYVDKEITRKYLGLKQVRKLIETFPILELDEDMKEKFFEIVKKEPAEKIIRFIKNLRAIR